MITAKSVTCFAAMSLCPLISTQALEKLIPESLAVRVFVEAAYDLNENSDFLSARCRDVIKYGGILIALGLTRVPNTKWELMPPITVAPRIARAQEMLARHRQPSA